jgi:signal transduction histidine kinase
MSVRIKLLITYLAGIVITVVIVMAIGIGLISYTLSYVAEGVVKNQTTEEAIRRGVDFVADLRYAERYDQEQLQSPSWIRDRAEQLEPFGGFLVVNQDQGWQFYGRVEQGEEFVPQLRLELDSADHEEGFMMFTWQERDYLTLKYDFPDISAPLTYYVVLDMSNEWLLEGAKSWFWIGFLLLLSLILVPLLWITTFDIIRPLRQLEMGSRRIAEGDLNFELKSNLKNEVGQVIRSYERMRSELKKAIDTQMALEENRKQLLTNISHDLKTPLTSIKGYVEGIREGVADDPAKLRSYINVIHVKTHDLDRMIDDLFLLSKLDLEQEHFHKEHVLLHEFYLNCMEELRLEFESEGIRFTGAYRLGDDTMIFIDAQKIKRVILNLVDNAVKFMDKETPHVDIVFDREDGFWLVAITDNGPGLAPEEIERIFERFYRTDPARNLNIAGSGLGLSIAKQIVENHQGSIDISSEHGEYTTVRFRIPLEAKEKAIAIEKEDDQ